MNRITKSEAKAQRQAHAKAVAENRVLRVDFSFITYPTTEARDAAALEYSAMGLEAFKVPAIPSPYEA